MKKLFNGRFLFILASSIVVLILLTLGAFYLFNDEDDTFIKSGYVLNPLSSTSEKYFFDEKVGYKENLSSMVEFVDVDKNTVSVLKDSFLHYSDESMSFLKKGAILDLSSIKGDKAVAFYNISSKSVIEKKDSGYYIDSSFGEIKMESFMGRISDNKYIVAGNLSLKVPGNDTAVKGEYFEIVYVEEGIVNIENKDVKFQVAAEGTVVSVGNHIKIDLGDKKIVYDKEDVMSITAITIDGDENIEIIPKVEEEEEPEVDPGAGGGAGNGDGNGDGDGNGSGDGDDKPDSELDKIEEILITIKDIKIGSTDIDVIFEIQNAKEDDIFKLQVVNLSSGKTVDVIPSVVNDALIQVNLLTPSTKYLFIVINEKDNNKYFQKVVETSGFGIKLEKEFATNNSLSYKVSVDENADISNAKLTLYVYNEKTNQNEIAKSCYTDTVTKIDEVTLEEITVTEETCYEKVVSLAELFEDITGEHSILFEGLESDTIYNAVLDEFSVASYNFKDIYNITLTSMTLKEVPTFAEMIVDKNVGTGSFDLSLSNIKDPDNAITKYTYLIYDKFTDKLAIDPIVHSNASPLTVDIGEGENKLKNDTNYYYKVIIEYFDNEKYIEYVTTDSIVFMMGDDPYITIVPNYDLISHVAIGATIYLTDNSCLVSMPDRERCSGASSTTLEISRINSLTGERIPMPSHSKEFTFEVTDEEIKYNLYLENLQPGTMYNIEVKAILNNSESLEPQELLQTDESKRNISTKYLSSFNVNWENYQSSANHVVNTGLQLSSVNNSSSETPEETLKKMDRVILKLYQGERPADFSTVSPLKTLEFHKDSGIDFKEKFYDAIFGISSSDTFGLTIDQLKKFNAEDAEDPGKLTEYYTILVEAYVDGHSINLVNPSHEYKISSLLLLDDVVDPVIKIDDITNSSAGGLFPNLNNGGTVVGYKITAAFDRNSLITAGIVPEKINYYVYDKDDKPLKFYVLNKDKELELKKSLTFNLKEEGFHETSIYIDYGTVYENVDDVMSRGNLFKIGYEVVVKDANGLPDYYPSAPVNAPRDSGLFQDVESAKETPSIKMYISKSTADSIIYKYEVKDPDNAFYKAPEDENASMYYSISGQEAQKYPLTLVPEATFNHYQGELVINGLVRDNTYKIFYKKNVVKTGKFEKDVLDFIDEAYSSGDRIFEGYYDPEFKYEIINNPSSDNKVGIKILADETLRNRILSYRLEFTATYADGSTVNDASGKQAKLFKELWELTECGSSTSKQCLYVDYSELKNAGMKSDWVGSKLVTKNIKVVVTAYYDNGLTGYDYKVGSSSTDDFPYMIMQDDLIKNVEDPEAASGNYISFTASGQAVTVWTEKLGTSKGYYTYTLNGSILKLKTHLKAIEGRTQNVSVNLTSSGYTSKNGHMNPKMVSVKEMKCEGAATFAFDSITPMASVSRKTGIVNGTLLGISLSGIDLTEILEHDGEYYLYVETWDQSSYDKAPKNGSSVKCGVDGCEGTFRPVQMVKINKSKPLSAITALIDGLATNTDYYHQIYIKKKSVSALGYEYIQLFDAGNGDNNIVKAYKFKTGKAGDLFQNVTLGLEISEEVYGERRLKTGVTLIEYGFSLPFNFDLVYVICDLEQADSGVCGITEDVEKGISGEEGMQNILQSKISQENVKKDVSSLSDALSKEFDFGRKYYVYVYAVADYYADYKETGSEELTKVNIRLNSYVAERQVRFLTEPSFEVTREAGIKDDKYYIDFNITVKDPDKTLIGGKYKIKLQDANAQDLLGADGVTLQVKDEKGVFQDVVFTEEADEFSALEINKTIRIIGLEGNSVYYFTVYNDVYIRNYDESKVDPTEEDFTYEISRSYTVYTTNTYGISFGNVLFNATSNSFVITFKGGSSFDKVVGIDYTIQVADALSTQIPTIGYYKIPEEKQFEISKESSEYYFVINPAGLTNNLEEVYVIAISFDVEDKDGNIIRLSNIDYPEFNGEVIYVK